MTFWYFVSASHRVARKMAVITGQKGDMVCYKHNTIYNNVKALKIHLNMKPERQQISTAIFNLLNENPTIPKSFSCRN